MPLPLPDFQRISFDEANPFLKGMSASQDLLTKSLANMKAGAELPYAGPQAKANVDYTNALTPHVQAETKKILEEIPWIGREKASEIALRNYQGQLASSEAAKNNYMLKHPGYLAGDTGKTIQYLTDAGFIPPGSLGNNSNVTARVPPPQDYQVNNNASPAAPTAPAQPIAPGSSTGMGRVDVNPQQPAPLRDQLSQMQMQGQQEQQGQQGQRPGAEPLHPKYQALAAAHQTGQSDPAAGIAVQPGFNMVNDSAPFNTGNRLADAELNRPFAQAAYQRKMVQGFNYLHATPEAKNYMIAQLAGAGIDPSVAISRLSNGETVPEILKSAGFDPANAPDPDFLPTRGNVQQLKQRQAALKEVDKLSSFISSGLGPYSRSWFGYSPKQIGQAMLGMNPEEQKKFLAARMLAPELSSARLMLAQGKTGITAIQQIMDKSLINAKSFQSFVSPEVFKGAQEMADAALRDSFYNAQTVYTVGKQLSKNFPDKSNQGTTKKYIIKNNQLVEG